MICPGCSADVHPLLEPAVTNSDQGFVMGKGMIQKCPQCMAVIPPASQVEPSPELQVVSVSKPAKQQPRTGPVDIEAMIDARLHIIDAELATKAELEKERSRLLRMKLAAQAAESGVATIQVKPVKIKNKP